MISGKPGLRIYSLAGMIMLIIGWVLSSQAFAEGTEGNLPFGQGEKLCYKIKVLFQTVGTMDITFNGRDTLDGKPVYHVTAYSDTLLGGKDTEQIFADRQDFLPILVKRRVESGSKVTFKHEIYDRDDCSVKIINPEKPEKVLEHIQMSQPLQNIIMLIYQARTMDMSEGNTLDVCLPKKEFTLNVAGKQTVDVPLGTHEAIVLKSEPKNAEIWLSDDEQRLPLKIVASMALTSYRMELFDVEQTRGKNSQQAGEGT